MQEEHVKKSPVGNAIVFIVLGCAIVLSSMAFASWMHEHPYSLETNTKLGVQQ